MARTRLMPHLVADPAAVTWGTWWGRLDGHRKPLGDKLDGWDYSSALTVELQPSLDVVDVLDQTGIANPGDIDVVVLLDCAATGRRFTTSTTIGDLVSGNSNVLSLNPPIGEIADTIRLSAHLAANKTRVDSTGGMVRIGSRLAWSDVHTVRLEGDNPRFPTEAVAFSSLGLEDAAWAVQLNFTDLNEAFMGSVRLLINTDHTCSHALLDSEHALWASTQSVLKVDIARQLLVHVTFEDFDFSDDHWPEESVRDVLEKLTDLYLGSDLATTVQLVKGDYLRFERRLQARFDLLRGLA